MHISVTLKYMYIRISKNQNINTKNSVEWSKLKFLEWHSQLLIAFMSQSIFEVFPVGHNSRNLQKGQSTATCKNQAGAICTRITIILYSHIQMNRDCSV